MLRNEKINPGLPYVSLMKNVDSKYTKELIPHLRVSILLNPHNEKSNNFFKKDKAREQKFTPDNVQVGNDSLSEITDTICD